MRQAGDVWPYVSSADLLAVAQKTPQYLTQNHFSLTNSCQPVPLIRSYAVIRCLRFEESTMSEAEARPTNFIRQIIDEDLASGKHTTVHTVSRRSRMAICILAMRNLSA